MRRGFDWFIQTYGALDGQKLGLIVERAGSKAVRPVPLKRRYSVTGDILSYRRCPRQYGFFARRGFAPAESGQLWFGTVIHRTLDRAYSHWRGDIAPELRGELPTDSDIKTYFNTVTEVLEAQHIRPLGDNAKEKALLYISRFNRLEGPRVYPRIRDTEHLLQKDTGKYIMHGVVDVLASTADGAGLERPAALEIWDYKGARLPDPTRSERDLKNYQFQMRVYAHLYKLRWNVAPAKSILWFLAEDPPSSGRLEVDIKPSLVDEAVRVFEGTVSEIEDSIDADSWPAPTPQKRPASETCDACDVRWGCQAHKDRPYRIRTIGPYRAR